MDTLFTNLEISATGLSAERLRMDVISNNIANANTVNAADGVPYKRRSVVLGTRAEDSFSASFKNTLGQKGVEVLAILEDNSPPQLKYDPANPLADQNGMVELSNVNVLNEMVDMISASRAYEANVTAIESTKSMIKKAISMGNL